MVKTVFALIENKNGGIALIQEGGEQARGLWCLPGGHVDKNETLEEAVFREVKEEAGLDIRIIEKIITVEMEGGEYRGAFSDNDQIIEINVFKAEASNFAIQAGDQELDARWFTKNEIGKLDLRWNFLRNLLIEH